MTQPLAPTHALLQTLAGNTIQTPPIWLMRQAGRYLPEYREIRSKTSNFLEFCYTPELAVEATLQPIRRFEFDASILFSDILVMPHGLGQHVWFETGEGPRLETHASVRALSALLSTERMVEFLQPVYTAAKLIREALPPSVTFIGFSGAPWTLACYMLEGKGSRDYPKLRHAAYTQPDDFTALIHTLEAAIIAHCSAQIDAGAQVIQLFDSWAGACPHALIETAIIQPTARIVAALQARYPHVPVIAFPKGLGHMAKRYLAAVNAQGFSVDYTTDLCEIRTQVGVHVALQGNLDPELLASASPAQVKASVRAMCDTMKDSPYIMNLGHGIVPHTPIANVEALIEAVRSV
jgi:uroporphyrinogen decarboxylase